MIQSSTFSNIIAFIYRKFVSLVNRFIINELKLIYYKKNKKKYIKSVHNQNIVHLEELGLNQKSLEKVIKKLKNNERV